MTILSYKSIFAGQVDIHPRLVRMTTDDPINIIETPGYINKYKNDLIIDLIESDMLFVTSTDGVFVEKVSIGPGLFITLSRFTNQP